MSDFVDEIFAVFAAHGGEHYGETVTQLEHALQCGHLAVEDGAPDSLIAAALLHDYGHFFEGRGETAQRHDADAHHEAHGAALLRRWFGPEVTAPIALHVAAKRYLCRVEPDYAAGLSAASRLSLKLQGGAFGVDQAKAFEAAPFAAEAVRLRRYDDTGKIAGVRMPGLASYGPLLTRLGSPSC